MEAKASSIQVRAASCPDHGDYEAKALVLLGERTMWSRCPECNRIESEREAEHKRLEQERDRQRRIERALDQAGIPHRFRGRTFATFVADSKGKVTALHAAKDFADEFQDRYAEGATMVFSGLPGTGKSHLAIAACQQVMLTGRTAMYMNALDAIRLVRSTWSKSSERTEIDVMRSFTDVDLLVLDEVGAQYGTEGEQVILFDIINRRYQDQKPMILLTNQGKDGFKQYLGDRAFDRLRECGRWVAFDWKSYRGEA